MWKAVGRDVACMVSAVVVTTLTAALLTIGVTLWVLPFSTTCRVCNYVPLGAAVAAPLVVALASFGVLLYVPFRGRGRIGSPIGRPYWQDLLLTPFLAGLGLALASVAIAVVIGEREDAALAFLLGLALAVPLALAALAVALTQRWTARPVRALGLTAVALTAVWIGGRFALDAWGDRIFAEYKATALVEIAAERQRIAADRRPVLFGASIEEDAAKRYRVLTERIADSIKGSEVNTALAKTVKAGPAVAPEPDAVRWIQSLRPELQSLREAVRCTRCDWRYEWEKGFDGGLPNLFGARMAANLMVLEGYERAAAGDVQGAVERDLEVIRMGSDYGSAGAVIGTLIALALERTGTDALLQLMATDGRAEPRWDEIVSRLDVLEPRLASAGVGFRGERLSYVGLEPQLGAVLTFLDEPRVPRLLERSLPGRFIVADCVRSQNATLRAMEKASEIVDLRESARQSQEALERGLRTRNPIVQMSLPSLSRAHFDQAEAIARFRLLRAAVLLEKARGRDGRYPADATAVDLPTDPFAYPKPLRYEALREGRGYKLWSVGANGTDEGGTEKGHADEVFERKPRA